MKNRIIVSVDGPAGSGKSSISRSVALRKGLKYIDSGAIYRSITWFLLNRFKDLNNKIDYSEVFSAFLVRQEFLPAGQSLTYVNDLDVSEMIRDEAITRNIGSVSDKQTVRDYVNTMLRQWATSESIIMDGRDIGTVVFPDADLKIYLDASVDIRAERRIKEYREMGKNVDEKDIKKQIILRDEQDMSRSFGALVRSDDMAYIDTSNMNINEVIKKIEILISKINK